MPEVRWEMIANDIRKSINNGEYKCGDRLPSENELVAKWKVSRMTAHRAMQELQREGVVTRKRGFGTVVADQRQNGNGVVGLLFNHKDSAFEVGYLVGIRRALADHYKLLFCSVETDPEREARYFEEMKNEADGIISFPTADPRNTAILQSVIDADVPVICIDRVPNDVEVDAVVTDNYGSSLNALRYLASKGHRYFAYFGANNLHVSASRDRYEAYLQIMKEVEVPEAGRYVRWFPPGPTWDMAVQEMEDALYRLLREKNPPTAIYCLHDFFIAGALEACERLGVSVPDEIELVGICDYPPWMLRNFQSINRVVQQTHLIGETAAGILQRRIDGDDSPKEIVRVPATFQPAELARKDTKMVNK